MNHDEHVLDFYRQFTLAVKQVSGAFDPNTIYQYQNMRLYEVVNILAQNDIRMTYQPPDDTKRLKSYNELLKENLNLLDLNYKLQEELVFERNRNRFNF